MTPAPIFCQFPTFAIVFTVFESARSALEKKFPKQSTQAIDTAAVLAGSLAGSLWSTPCEVVKCTFQVSHQWCPIFGIAVQVDALFIPSSMKRRHNSRIQAGLSQSVNQSQSGMYTKSLTLNPKP